MKLNRFIYKLIRLIVLWYNWIVLFMIVWMDIFMRKLDEFIYELIRLIYL